MKHLTTSTSSQSISFIPRAYVSTATLYLRDEVSNTSTSTTVSLTSLGGYSTLSNEFSLKEGRFYELKILNGSEVIYRDKVFCTDQAIDQAAGDSYNINLDEYTEEDSYDNEYITI